MANRPIDEEEHGYLFWRERFYDGKSGHWVRGASLNEVVCKWIAQGIKVAAIRLHPDNEANVDVLIVRDDKEASDA